jgi:hypothetical protein
VTTSRKVGAKSVNISTRLGQIASAVPVGIPPVLQRFWKFTRDMAKRFNKNLQQDREEELTQAVVEDFKRKQPV